MVRQMELKKYSLYDLPKRKKDCNLGCLRSLI